MKRLLAAIGLVALVCWWRGRHDPKRQFIGGHRCKTCGCPFADLGEVDPHRRQEPRWRRGSAA